MKLSEIRWIVFAHDLTWVPVTLWLAYWFRFNLSPIPEEFRGGFLVLLIVMAPIYAASFWAFGCYRGVWRYASLPDLWRICRAVISGALVAVLAIFLYNRLHAVPRSVLILQPILLAIGLIAPRVLYRAVKDRLRAEQRRRAPLALVVGAGREGELLARDMRAAGSYSLAAFVDDDPQKQGNEIHGIRVRGTLADVPRLIADMDIDIVLIAMSEASRTVLDSVVSMSAEAGVTCRIVPSISELADGRVTVSRLRSVTVEDLLGREPICLDEASILGYLEDHVVLVTGGGGSIGSELCRQVARHSPEMLLIIDHSEFNLYRIEQELRQDYPGLNMQFLLGDVTSERIVRSIFSKYRPSVVFHAAAYKHVPMLEGNIAEGIRNNVFGTRTVAETSVEFGSERFVLVSTDKTVNPANVMGATKRVAEIICQNLGRRTATQFITTRFGNVLGSAGSVVPLFESQIAAGGPVTVTHPDVTRYFMTISEATSLILQAGAMGQGGEIYVMDMGKPVSIRVLAEKLIQLSGLKPYRDIELEFTGLRPGEKLHEELFYSGEELLSTPHPKLLLADSFVVDWGWLRARLDELRETVEADDVEAALACLRVLIPEFSQRQGQSAQTKPNLRSVN